MNLLARLKLALWIIFSRGQNNTNVALVVLNTLKFLVSLMGEVFHVFLMSNLCSVLAMSMAVSRCHDH